MYTTIQSFVPSWITGIVSVNMMLVLLILAVVFWQFRPYFAYISELIAMAKSLMDATIGVMSSTSTNIVDSTATGSNVVVDKISGKKKPKTVPEPDDSTSTVQGGAAGGFCLAGEWKGVRSCVRVEAGKDCRSGKVFSTKEQCVTPESEPESGQLGR